MKGNVSAKVTHKDCSRICKRSERTQTIKKVSVIIHLYFSVLVFTLICSLQLGINQNTYWVASQNVKLPCLTTFQILGSQLLNQWQIRMGQERERDREKKSVHARLIYLFGSSVNFLTKLPFVIKMLGSSVDTYCSLKFQNIRSYFSLYS